LRNGYVIEATTAIWSYARTFLTPILTENRGQLRRAVRTGATYSQGFPITPPEKANEIGQVYHGLTVLITDALCYSTTGIFAAGYQDHGIGIIIGTDENTGAGGANVWDHRLLSQLFGSDESPYQGLHLFKPHGSWISKEVSW
jgi:C-terminal processing protease CtpA/Prc